MKRFIWWTLVFLKKSYLAMFDKTKKQFRGLFGYSIIYLFALFFALIIESVFNRWILSWYFEFTDIIEFEIYEIRGINFFLLSAFCFSVFLNLLSFIWLQSWAAVCYCNRKLCFFSKVFTNWEEIFSQRRRVAAIHR